MQCPECIEYVQSACDVNRIPRLTRSNHFKPRYLPLKPLLTKHCRVANKKFSITSTIYKIETSRQEVSGKYSANRQNYRNSCANIKNIIINLKARRNILKRLYNIQFPNRPQYKLLEPRLDPIGDIKFTLNRHLLKRHPRVHQYPGDYSEEKLAIIAQSKIRESEKLTRALTKNREAWLQAVERDKNTPT